MLKKILSCVLVITMLIGIIPAYNVFASNPDIEAFSTNSITVQGRVRYMYKEHGGILERDARAEPMPHIAVSVTLYVFNEDSIYHPEIPNFTAIGTQQGNATASGNFSITIPTAGFSLENNSFSARVTAIAKDEQVLW